MYNSHKYVVRILSKFADALHMCKWIESVDPLKWITIFSDALHMYKWIERDTPDILFGAYPDALHMCKWIERTINTKLAAVQS